MNNVKTSTWITVAHKKQKKSDKIPKRYVYCKNCEIVIADDVFNQFDIKKQSDLMSVDTFNEHKKWFKFCNNCGCFMQ